MGRTVTVSSCSSRVCKMATDPTQEYHTQDEPHNTETDETDDAETYEWYTDEAGFPLLGLLLNTMGSFGIGFVFGRCSVGR